tara:strand:- start:115 stop:363 length:249 start_codon:yes stop_codon:yes gene_type:complete
MEPTQVGKMADNLSMIMYIILPWLINIGEMGRWPKRKFFNLCNDNFGLCHIEMVLGSRLGVNLDLFDLSIGLWIISEALFRF